MTSASFDDTIRLLNDLYHKPRVPAEQAGLHRVEHLLRNLGDPHRSFRSVHVTGSCGKGSTTTMIGSILQASGFRTGYFRSPHLQSYMERIAINEADISQDDWSKCFNRMWPIVEGMQRPADSGYRLGRPTVFEVLFALMSLYFAENGVEWASVETGLGGRLDATNTLSSDVAVITNVSLEHTKVLGNDVESIAREKAAIIKEGSSAVTASEDPDALDVIEERSRCVGSPLFEVNRDVRVTIESEDLYGETLLLSHGIETLEVDLPIAGDFQATNAGTAFAAIKALQARRITIEDSAIQRGLSSVRMPGRFEVIGTEPLIIVDGAHSPAGAGALATTIENLGLRDVEMLFAAQADKDVGHMAEQLGPLVDRLILTRVPESDRSANPRDLQAAFEPFVGSIAIEDDVDRALEIAEKESESRSATLITGSLYLVGYCRAQLATQLVAI